MKQLTTYLRAHRRGNYQLNIDENWKVVVRRWREQEQWEGGAGAFGVIQLTSLRLLTANSTSHQKSPMAIQ